MGKIKIGLIILGLIVVVGLIIGGVAMAKSPFNTINSNNGKAKYVPDEVIVKFKEDVKPFRVIKVPKGKVREKIKEYLRKADVEYAEPNYYVYALMVPNDEYYDYQWHLDNPEYGGIQMEKAWDISTGSGVTVAVIDTGVRKGTDLADTCFVSGYDFVNDDSDPIDDNRHGTHVAGTVAQSTNNSIGVAGVAFDACLMPVKVLDSDGSGTYADVAEGIYFAVDNGAKVINLSLGGPEPATYLEEALAYAYSKGVTIVAAAGNDSSPTLSYPAAYDDYVIAVGATQYDENLAPYSNYGPSLDLVAPGGNLDLDQNNDGYGDGVLQQTFRKYGPFIRWGYYFFEGTSMAAPHVSGVAALLLANGNATTPDEVRAALQETAEDLGEPGRDNTYGYGLVDAYAALQWTAGPDITPPVISNGKPTGAINDNTPVLEVTTDEKAICKGSIDVDEPYAEMDFTFTADSNGTSHAYEVTTPLTDGDHTPYVKCEDEAGNVNETSYSWTFTVDTTAPEKVTGLNVTPVSDSQLDLSWNPVSDAVKYNIYRDGGYLNSTTATTYSDTGLTPATTYCYKVSAVDQAGNEGPKSERVCGTTKEAEKIKCWSADYQYLYRNKDQVKKFCKCAQGTYGYNSYAYKLERETVYKYVDTNDNEIWDVESRSSYLPVYEVTCTDGKVYLTNQDYFYPK
ncbi:MAG: hypothetical protein B5M48_04035 [Candidatus Omnitrophica bacterium 4484_213]|nr:MAG: hypothetical protein B5M48_04035 [Candidatus Omnitrophica bacterium 4484_213]